MKDYLGKPFTTQELWKLLLKYLQPVDKALIPDNDFSYENELKKEPKN
jgi:hypothetical protein